MLNIKDILDNVTKKEKLCLTQNKEFTNYSRVYLSIKYTKDKGYILISLDYLYNFSEDIFYVKEFEVIIKDLFKNKLEYHIWSNINKSKLLSYITKENKKLLKNSNVGELYYDNITKESNKLKCSDRELTDLIRFKDVLNSRLCNMKLDSVIPNVRRYNNVLYFENYKNEEMKFFSSNISKGNLYGLMDYNYELIRENNKKIIDKEYSNKGSINNYSIIFLSDKVLLLNHDINPEGFRNVYELFSKRNNLNKEVFGMIDNNDLTDYLLASIINFYSSTKMRNKYLLSNGYNPEDI